MDQTPSPTDLSRTVLCLGEAMVEFAPSGDGETFRRGFAGDTLNTCLYLARLFPAGSQLKAAYVTRLGDDALSAGMLSAWDAEGIGTDLIERVPGGVPGLYTVAVDGAGERHFTYWRSTAPARGLFADTAALQPSHLTGCAALYLSAISLAILESDAQRALLIDLMDRLSASGTRVAFDTNYRPRLWPDGQTARYWIDRALGASTVASASADDLAPLYGDDDPQRLLAMMPPTNHGSGERLLKADGVVHLDHEDARHDIALDFTSEPVDTTGAGDSFNGAYLAARLRGEAPKSAIATAHGLASIVVAYPGAIIPRSAMP